MRSENNIRVFFTNEKQPQILSNKGTTGSRYQSIDELTMVCAASDIQISRNFKDKLQVFKD